MHAMSASAGMPTAAPLRATRRPLCVVGLLAAVILTLSTLQQPQQEVHVQSVMVSMSHVELQSITERASSPEQDECAGWLNGTRDTYRDPIYGNVVSGGFTSQAQQDSLLWKHIFSRLGRRGVYLDVAANHFKRVSNTYFYDVCAKWSGICVEPNPVYHEELRSRRSCELVPTCASDSATEVEIALPVDPVHGLLGGVNGGLTRSRVHATRKQWNITIRTDAERNVVKLRCAVLKEVLATRRVDHVDLLSLDVEGHEAAVLDGLDLDAVRVDYVLCEATRVCAAKLGRHGYEQIHLPGWPAKGDTVWRHSALSPPPASPPCAPTAPAAAATLSYCRSFPCLGFGTAGAKTEAVEMALRVGYTLIDTAVLYRREREIASAIRASGVPRQRLTIVSKAWPFSRSIKGGSVNASVGLCEPEEMVARVEEHISALGVGHLDVLLLHWPPAAHALPSFWRALVDLKRRRLTHSIGLSNAGLSHLALLDGDAEMTAHPPAVVQTELSAVRSDLRISDEVDDLVKYCQRKRIRLMSHSSVKGLLKDKRAAELARAANVTLPQLGLRYGLQRGFTMLFGSRKRVHMVENLGALRFHLTKSQMASMACWRAHTSGECQGRLRHFSGTLWPTDAERAPRTPWRPIVGNSATELLQQHPDPLGALGRGSVPAIVLRGQLDEGTRRAVLRRLLVDPAVAHLWSSAKESFLTSKYGCLGRQINNHMKSSTGGAAEYARLSRADIQKLRSHGLWAPVRTLYESLRAIAGTKRSVGPAVDLATNSSYSPAAYRFSQNGGYFGPHVDSMHAQELRNRLCPEPVSSGVDPQRGVGVDYPDAYRFDTQFSALVLLQAGGEATNRTSSALTIHEVHLDDLETDCMLQVAPTAWNTAVTLCPGCPPSERNSKRLGEWRRLDLAVEEGDVYIFNSNFVHEVHAVTGPSKRVTLGAFVGYSEQELRVWI